MEHEEFDDEDSEVEGLCKKILGLRDSYTESLDNDYNDSIKDNRDKFRIIEEIKMENKRWLSGAIVFVACSFGGGALMEYVAESIGEDKSLSYSSAFILGAGFGLLTYGLCRGGKLIYEDSSRFYKNIFDR